MRALVAGRIGRDLIRLCECGFDSVTLRRGVMRRLRLVVPYDAYCCGTIDPVTFLITSEVSEGIPAVAFGPVAHNEYLQEDFHKFSELARSAHPAGILRQATGGVPERSPRCLMLSNFGIEHELRVAFTVDGECWGGVSMFRHAGAPGFTDEEGSFVARLGPHLARALRACLRQPRGATDGTSSGPGLVLLDEGNRVDAITPAAEWWLRELTGSQSELLDSMPLPLLEVAARARALARGLEQQAARMRLRTPAGRWLILHASPVRERSQGRERIAVLFEEPPAQEIVPLILSAYSLTDREQDVVQLVLAGSSSAEIAAALEISPLTVQDHLKSVFDKFGLRTRKQLVAQMLGAARASAVGGLKFRARGPLTRTATTAPFSSTPSPG